MSENIENENWSCSCGAFSSGSFCPSCGKKKPENSVQYCAKCGAELHQDARFCKACGAPVVTRSDASSTVTPQQPQQQANYQSSAPMPPQKKPKNMKKGCLIAVLAVIALFIILALANGGEFNFSSANISEPAMASSVDSKTMKPLSKTDVFTTQSPVVYATFLLKNAPTDTKLTAKWIYVDAKMDIGTVDLKSTQTNQYIAFNLTKPNNGFPVGEYKVEIYLNDKLKETLKFSVKK